jgi:hypothetical protein
MDNSRVWEIKIETVDIKTLTDDDFLILNEITQDMWAVMVSGNLSSVMSVDICTQKKIYMEISQLNNITLRSKK